MLHSAGTPPLPPSPLPATPPPPVATPAVPAGFTPAVPSPPPPAPPPPVLAGLPEAPPLPEPPAGGAPAVEAGLDPAAASAGGDELEPQASEPAANSRLLASPNVLEVKRMSLMHAGPSSITGGAPARTCCFV
ncbi:MAG: hypothetical protein EOO73_17995 [Myxococcales bacterium]|nr:MAG: hypothetical protein EOO73_17995 [Myxococcales bacterium]